MRIPIFQQRQIILPIIRRRKRAISQLRPTMTVSYTHLLTEEVKEITVAYGGKSAVVFIGVESPEKPGPEKPDPENPTPEKPNPEKPNPEDPKPGNGSGSENNGGTGSGSGSNSNNGSSGGNNTVNNIINNNNNNNSNSSNKNSGKVQTGDRNNLVFPLIGMTAARCV